MHEFRDTEVVLKFGIGFLMNLAKSGVHNAGLVLESGGIEMAVDAIQRYPGNEYLNENTTVLLGNVSEH
eukprot:gene23802-9968_t